MDRNQADVTSKCKGAKLGKYQAAQVASLLWRKAVGLHLQGVFAATPPATPPPHPAQASPLPFLSPSVRPPAGPARSIPLFGAPSSQPLGCTSLFTYPGVPCSPPGTLHTPRAPCSQLLVLPLPAPPASALCSTSSSGPRLRSTPARAPPPTIPAGRSRLSSPRAPLPPCPRPSPAPGARTLVA